MNQELPTRSRSTLVRLTESLLEPPAACDHMRAATLLTDHLWCVRERPSARVSDPRLLGVVAAEVALEHCHDDRDDVVWGELIHPGSIVWPVVMTVGAHTGASGAELLRAADAGYEAASRLATLASPALRGSTHLTALVGAPAAAVATAVLMRMDLETAADALGHSLSIVGGSAGALRELSGTRWFHRANAVNAGFLAATCAHDGVRATRGDLDAGDFVLAPASSELRRGLQARRFAMDRASVRIWPTSGWNQVAYECAAEVGRRASGTITEVTLSARVDRATAAASRSGDGWFDVRRALIDGFGQGVGAGEDLVGVPDVELVESDTPGASVTLMSASDHVGVERQEALDAPQRRASGSQLDLKWQFRRDVDALLAEVADVLRSSDPNGVDAILGVVDRGQTRRTLAHRQDRAGNVARSSTGHPPTRGRGDIG